MTAPVHPYSDFGVALRTLRSGRNWLGLLLFVCVLAQIIGFLLIRFTNQAYGNGNPVARESVVVTPMGPAHHPLFSVRTVTGGVQASTPNQAQPGVSAADTGFSDAASAGRQTMQSRQGRELNLRPQWATTYYIAVPVTQLLGLLAAASQAIIIFITLLVILIAQAPGVAHLTRSLNWAVILLFMVLPWQYFFPGFPVPGVLYGWQELLRTLAVVFLLPPGHGLPYLQRAIIVVRYVLWPAIGLLVMLVTAERFRAGVRLAVGHPIQSLMLGQNKTTADKPTGSAPPPPGLGTTTPTGQATR